MQSHAPTPAGTTAGGAIGPSENRAWPRPRRPWVMFMRWLNLAFLHWAVDPDQLRRSLPSGLALDTFDGRAWLGVIPFRMSDVRPRFVPPLPWLSVFPELNVRTYVTCEAKPGIWFFSLDAANPLAVRGARWGYALPYRDARMHVQQHDGWTQYRSVRSEGGYPPAEFVGRYRALGDVFHARPGSLEYFLTERHCLYAAGRHGRLYRGEIDHAPWPLQSAEACIESNTMASAAGIELPSDPPLVHFARRLDVVAWYLDRVAEV